MADSAMAEILLETHQQRMQTFCNNGLVSGQREAHPSLAEFKHLQSPIRIALTQKSNDGKEMVIRISNCFSFVPVDAFSFRYIIRSLRIVQHPSGRSEFVEETLTKGMLQLKE